MSGDVGPGVAQESLFEFLPNGSGGFQPRWVDADSAPPDVVPVPEMGIRMRENEGSAPSRTCKVEGCEGRAYVPGAGRGFCGKHYARARKQGLPELKRARGSCAADDCEAVIGGVINGKSYCDKHLFRLKRHGSSDHPDPSRRAPDGTSWCPRCQAYRPGIDFHANSANRDGLATWCKECTSANNLEWRRANPGIGRRPRWDTACRACGRIFKGNKHNRSFCSAECLKTGLKVYDREHFWANRERHAEQSSKSRRKYPEKARERSRVRRALIAKTTIEPINEREVYERDNWTCGICGEWIDAKVPNPRPRSPSIDHVIPINKGGPHVMSNLQAAHLSCNIRKGDKLVGWKLC